MRRRSTVVLIALGLARMVAAELVPQDGAPTYQRYCAGCHGDLGDGQGPAAAMLITKPRDFSKGIFKFRSTANGSLPTDADLLRTITNGVYRTSMPEWSLLPERERLALVAYVKSFYPQWYERGPGKPIVIPPTPADLGSAERVKRGRELYEGLECSTCHGLTGHGDGPSAAQLPLDEWGNPQKPFDFSKGRLKSGAAPEDDTVSTVAQRRRPVVGCANQIAPDDIIDRIGAVQDEAMAAVAGDEISGGRSIAADEIAGRVDLDAVTGVPGRGRPAGVRADEVALNDIPARTRHADTHFEAVQDQAANFAVARDNEQARRDRFGPDRSGRDGTGRDDIAAVQLDHGLSPEFELRPAIDHHRIHHGGQRREQMDDVGSVSDEGERNDVGSRSGVGVKQRLTQCAGARIRQAVGRDDAGHNPDLKRARVGVAGSIGHHAEDHRVAHGKDGARRRRADNDRAGVAVVARRRRRKTHGDMA